MINTFTCIFCSLGLVESLLILILICAKWALIVGLFIFMAPNKFSNKFPAKDHFETIKYGLKICTVLLAGLIVVCLWVTPYKLLDNVWYFDDLENKTFVQEIYPSNINIEEESFVYVVDGQEYTIPLGDPHLTWTHDVIKEKIESDIEAPYLEQYKYEIGHYPFKQEGYAYILHTRGDANSD